MRSDPGRPSRHYVYVLTVAGAVFYVGVGQHGRESPWRAVWRQRYRLNIPLARHLRGLAEPPVESTLLGTAVGLDGRTARTVADIVKAWFPATIHEPKTIGRNGRPVAKEEGDGIRLWPSRNQAALALGLTRPGVAKRIRAGDLIDAADWKPNQQE